MTLFFTAYDVLAAWHKTQQSRLGSKFGAGNFDVTYASDYAGSIAKDREILREKLRLARSKTVMPCLRAVWYAKKRVAT